MNAEGIDNTSSEWSQVARGQVVPYGSRIASVVNAGGIDNANSS